MSKILAPLEDVWRSEKFLKIFWSHLRLAGDPIEGGWRSKIFHLRLSGDPIFKNFSWRSLKLKKKAYLRLSGDPKIFSKKNYDFA